ncbi:twin-arginine translocase TatA/TatE family subunit [Sinomonas atrocyanea]|uniref:twin-arginine translocase TatA/TatE family subunit n=1 Tax=Sinomonas atrocyanea TaxID=37927 RepID=UPI00277EAA9B|nr:twin-arginine translocase TatA/TatE family subunit [Sinomonas atrocyanea]MDQ0258479.1 sec-independent protein translocase protein TatB [Sinomonas atrocyanea]MDR6620749.1 sec-independent protein translocase protein TatB [Sinomonas atrocyanea]
MFGINGPEFLILLVIGVLVIGPKRLPEYTQKLANIVKELRRMAAGAKEQLKEETGVDLSEVDWRKYDPRQYDPRKIIRDALMDDDGAGAPPAGAPAVAAAATAAAASVPAPLIERLQAGEKAPFDSEAT